MNQENALPRRKAMLYYPSQAKPRPVRLREKDRDPYDGLRPWSAITHGIGAALALLGTVLLLLRCAALSLSPWHVVSFLIYGVSMVGLYTASTLYHCRNVSVKGRIALRKYDHASIYFLIAGTYTPICLVVLRTDGAWGWALFGVIWALALAGLVLTLAWITAPRWLTAIQRKLLFARSFLCWRLRHFGQRAHGTHTAVDRGPQVVELLLVVGHYTVDAVGVQVAGDLRHPKAHPGELKQGPLE